MEYSIILDWKNFNVNLSKVRIYFKSHLSSNHDGLICDPDNLYVIFKSEISQEDINVVNNYWSNISLSTFNPTMQEIVTGKINDSIVFGNNMIIQAAVENVLLGITQLNKTKEVSDYLSNLQMYLRSGSLYAAINEIEVLKTAGLPSELSPFITETRLNTYKAQIQTYLGL